NGYIGINSIIGIFFPYFYLIYSDFIPFFNGADKLTFLYIGFLPLSFLILGFLNLKRIISEKPFAKYFFFLFAVTIAMLVKYIPLFYLVHKLPIFKLFGGTGKYATISFFALAIFSGFSFDSLGWIKQKNLSKFLNFYKYFLAIFTTISAAVTFVFYVFKNRILSFAENYFVKNLYESSKQRPMEHYRKLIQETYDGMAHNFSLNNTHYLLSFVFIFLSYFVLRAFHKDKISPQKFKILALAVVVLNLTFVWQGYFNMAPRSIIIDIPEDIKFINSNKTTEKPFRVFRFWGGLSEYVDMGLNQYDEKERIGLEIAMLAPNYSLLHDVQFIGGHENIMSARQSKIMAFIGSERAPKDKTWAQDQGTSTEDKVARFESPANRSLLSMLNVRYIVTSFDFKLPWKKVFETRVTKYNLPVYIYENPAFLPRIYLAKNVKFIASDNQKSFDKLLKISDFKNNTLIECGDNDCSGYKNYYSLNDSVEIKEIKSGYLEVKTSTKHPRWLVYSESNLPTWEVRLNNNPELLPIKTANYLFQAVYIPPGDNTTTFTYPGIWGQMKYSAESQLSKFFSQK
ncbi:MAG: hypothetical protein Q8N58_01620, partial [bacterium]|nr:hypothetical protein [bacterium]